MDVALSILKARGAETASTAQLTGRNVTVLSTGSADAAANEEGAIGGQSAEVSSLAAPAKVEKAAVTIQSIVRGHAGRKVAKSIAEEAQAAKDAVQY